MCGILFLKNPNLANDEAESRIRSALKKSVHRGPDEQNFIHVNGTYLAHTRLSIIDILDSQQPIRDPSGRYALIYNGEIYNFQQLRKSLLSHWTFKTKGDTEVLLAGLITHGPEFVEKLEGMWAFVLIDNKKNEIFLSRDRLGKKPLYFSRTPDAFYCASEIPAITELLDTSPSEDYRSTADYFRYGYFLPGTTAYKEIKELLPGHNLWVKPSGEVIQKPYWKISSSREHPNQTQAIEEIRDVFRESVQKRMTSDVEVGAFLSGGIDSSLIVHQLSELGITNLKTFTLGFNSKSFDESAEAKKISSFYKTDHYSSLLTSWNSDQMETIIRHNIGQPFADPSILPTAAISALAASKVKVVLSGDGGDELFSGYERYRARAIMRWYTRLPTSLRSKAEKAITALPEPQAHHSRSLLKKAHLFANLSRRIGSETPYVAPRVHSDASLSHILPQISQEGHCAPGLNLETELGDIEEMMLRDLSIYMPQDILLKVDRASMANSLEVRAPFLDHKLVELAFNLPLSWHRSFQGNKFMLKKTFQKTTPSDIWRKKKQGFGVPISEWLRADMGVQLSELIGSFDCPISPDHARELLKQHRAHKADHGFQLWQIYVYYLWLANKPK